MARTPLLLALALLAAACAEHTTAMPMHPDLLSFVKLPTAPVGEELLQQTAGRRLQQQFVEGDAPFTFDGFDFGFGGILPGGGFFDGFATNIYRILFGNILNAGLNDAIAGGLSNTPLQPLDFIPPTLGARLNRNVVSLFGYDAVDKFIGQYLARASASVGKLVDAGCKGPTYKLKVKGGECKIADSGSVECKEPTIVLSSTPYSCNLPYREAAELEGQSYKYSVALGRERKGVIGLPAGKYNFGAAVTVTTPYLGLSLGTARLANDFGLQQWYQFTGNLVLNELLRVQAALLSGAADSKILTTGAAGRSAAGAGARPIAEGVAAVADAGNALLDRIAQSMGISSADLTDGLKAVNILPAGAGQAPAEPAAKLAQPQPKPQAQPKPKQQPAAKKAAGPAAAAAAEKGSASGEVITQRTDEREGDQALLQPGPLVKKAEGAQQP